MRSKKEGGLGIRNLQAANHGLILSTAWRIAEQPNSQLYKVLQSKYFADGSIWRPKPNVPKSAFWASILKVIPLLQQNAFYQVTTGELSIWNSPWCSAWTRIYDDLIIQQTPFTYPATVNQLWVPGSMVWNNVLIDNLFLQPTADMIKHTPIIHSSDKDILCWKPTQNGKCTSKSAYRVCLKSLQEAGAPSPKPVDSLTLQILNQVWKCKVMIPRVKTFAWRLLRRAIPSGCRVSRFSTRIDGLCSRCGLLENDLHLFFTCSFARAAWFQQPWYIRADIFTQNCPSFSQIIKNLLSLDHPCAKLNHIFTFLWCLWKSRNDHLFCRKEGQPHQVAIATNALLQDLETDMVLGHSSSTWQTTASSDGCSGTDPVPGTTIRTDLVIAGPRIYTDAAWKQRRSNPSPTAGIGVYCHWQEANHTSDVFIQATASSIPSPIQAEASGLLLAASIATHLRLSEASFFTDNLSLARAAAAPLASHPAVLWEIRDLVLRFQQAATPLHAKVYHVGRGINGVAHNCAHQAKRSIGSMPTSSCRSSAHSNITCPVLSAIANIHLPGFVILSVLCF